MGVSDHAFVATKFRGCRCPGVIEKALRQLANDSAGVADSQLVCGNVSNYNATGADDGIVPDCHTRADDATASQPDVVSTGDWFSSFETASSNIRFERVPCGVNVHSRPDLSIVSDRNQIAIQEHATVIDESIATDPDVPAVVAAEG